MPTHTAGRSVCTDIQHLLAITQQHANFRISADSRGEPGTYHHAGPNELEASQLHVRLAPHSLGNQTHDSRRKRYAVRILVPLAVCKDKEDKEVSAVQNLAETCGTTFPASTVKWPAKLFGSPQIQLYSASTMY